MPYTATLQLRAKVQPSIKFKAKVQPNIKIKAQGLGEMISVRVSLSSTTFLNRGAVAFSPYSLFTFGTQGVWFDPSDAANLDWRRNLLQWTQEFDNPFWVKQSGTVATANQAVAPDGTTTADLVVGNGTNGIFTSGIAVPVTVNTKSIWLRGVSGGEVVQLKDPNLTIGTITCNLTTSWQRFSLPEIQTMGLAGLWVAGIPAGGIYMWGAQIELGPVATEYQRISDLNTEVLERFPNTTLYQDPAGTTAVTTPGQTVGLMLDKSKGLVLGSELVTNGDFASGTTGWSVTGGTQAVVSGALVVTPSPSGVVYSSQSFATVIGRTYQVRGSILAGTSTFFAIRKGDGATGGANQVTLRSSVGNLVGVFTATATTSFVILQANDSGSATFDNISIKELPGNHATQATLAARPTYAIEPAGGRRNLLIYSEQLDNGNWAKDRGTISANTTIAPDGTLTADTLTATSGLCDIYQSVLTLTSGQAYTGTVYLKRKTGTGPISYVTLNGGRALITETVTSSEWTRVTTTSTASSGTGFCGIRLGTSGDELYLWGAQLELGSTATPYQRVTTQYDVTEAGKPTMSYLYFDGVNDSMVTSTITPGTDKVQVFAGLRKLNDVTGGVVAEPSIGNLTGTFQFYAGDSATAAGPYWTFGSKGTLDKQAVTGATFSAPRTNVLTGLGDIGGSRVTLRANGVQVAQTIGSQGTGNFLAYPIYIGARAGTNLFFTGHFYSFITRFGATLDTPSITSTESWVASKTGFYSPVITGVPTVGVS